MRGARIIIHLYGSIRSYIDQEPGDVSKILIHLVGHILKRVRDVCIQLAAQRRVPIIVAGGPRQHRGERGEEVAKRPGDDNVIVEINVKRD